VHALADRRALQALGQRLPRDGRGIGLQHRLQRGRQARPRRVGRVLAAGAAAQVAFAGQQQRLEAVGPAQRVAAFQQAQHGGGRQPLAAVHVAMLARHHVGQLAAVGGHAQPLAQGACQFGAARFVAVVAWPVFRGRLALAQVMAQAGPAYRQRRGQARAGLQHQQQVHTGVDLGVVLGALRHAPQPRHLGQQARQRAGFAQHLEQPRRVRFHQPAREFLPHPFGHQRVDLAVADHAAHQRHRLGGDRKIGPARREARHAQQSHRILDEGVRDMAQHARAQVALAAMGVDQAAVLVARHRIDGEVAPRQVLLERDVGRGVKLEAVVAAAGLALGACQRHLLAGLRVQEDRKVTAHRAVAGRQQLLRRAADGDPVAVTKRQAQQAVAHGAADDIELHRQGLAGRCR